MRLPPWNLHADVLAIAAALEGAHLWAVARLSPKPAAIMAGNGNGSPSGRSEPATSRRQIVWFTSGVLVFLVASSWPIHDLSERYLFSVHMFQHMLISLVVPPMLLLGLPPWLLRKILSPPPLNWIVRNLAGPFFALVLFNAVIVATHWPLWVNFTLEHHPFHLLVHVILFGAATLMWWPVVAPLPEMPG